MYASKWTILKDAGEVVQGRVRVRVLRHIQENGATVPKESVPRQAIRQCAVRDP
jgi:hypothetical protein